MNEEELKKQIAAKETEQEEAAAEVSRLMDAQRIAQAAQDDQLISAINRLKAKGIKITPKAVAEASGVSVDQVKLRAEDNDEIKSALVVEEIMALIRMEGISTGEITYINEGGNSIKGIMFNPEIDGFDFDIVLKKEKIKDLYERFVSEDDELTEEIIGEAISFGVLSPFLTLVNL